jgi:predicted ATP-grasp superfamily ATP-dependent carboligase
MPMHTLMRKSPRAAGARTSAPAAPRSTRAPSLDVLLLDAQNRQALACLRAYARAGLRVGAVACTAEAAGAPSLRSRWCALQSVVPDFSADANAYLDAVLDLLREHPARVLLPGHDGSIEALRSRRAELEQLTALPLPAEAALDVAVSKARTLALAECLGIATPRGVQVNDLADVPAALREVGVPAVVKPVQSWVERGGVGTRITSEPALTEDDARRSLDYMLAVGGSAIIQQWLPGRREAVSIFYAANRVWARFAQASHREFPVLGGVSVLSESIPLLPEITEAAEQLVRAIDLEGCSMVEFRRDAAGHPTLMEINPRIGGSVRLAIECGVNFPLLVYAWATGAPLSAVEGYRVGRRLRWLSGDIWNLKCAFDSQGHPDVPPRGKALATFFSDFVLRPATLDFVDPQDMLPALVEMRETVGRHMLGRLRRLAPRTQ